MGFTTANPLIPWSPLGLNPKAALLEHFLFCDVGVGYLTFHAQPTVYVIPGELLSRI